MPMKEEKRKIKAQKVLESLTEREIKDLHRDNPFITVRNEAIRELRSKKVEHEVIGLVTGLSLSQVKNISDRRGYKNGHREVTQADLRGIRRSFRDLWKEIIKLLGDKKK